MKACLLSKIGFVNEGCQWLFHQTLMACYVRC
jgi:hypothetical protein